MLLHCMNFFGYERLVGTFKRDLKLSSREQTFFYFIFLKIETHTKSRYVFCIFWRHFLKFFKFEEVKNFEVFLRTQEKFLLFKNKN